MRYQGSCRKHGALAMPDSFDRAATESAIHRVMCNSLTETLAICPNCEQWRRDGDCLNACASRKFAEVAGPSTLNM